MSELFAALFIMLESSTYNYFSGPIKLFLDPSKFLDTQKNIILVLRKVITQFGFFLNNVYL